MDSTQLAHMKTISNLVLLCINLIIMRVKGRIIMHVMWKEFGIFLSFHYSTISMYLYIWINNNVCVSYLYGYVRIGQKGFHVLMRHDPKKTYQLYHHSSGYIYSETIVFFFFPMKYSKIILYLFLYDISTNYKLKS